MWWVAHRRMSGNFLLRPQDAPDEPFIRARFRLDDGNELRFVDLRKFGTMTLVDDPAPLLADLGPEPLDAAFTAEALAAIAEETQRAGESRAARSGRDRRHRQPLRRRGAPLREGPPATHRELAQAGRSRALRDGIVRALEQGLRNCGSSVGHVVDGEEVSLRDHVNLNGQSGKNQEYLVAYGREGRPCRNCGTAIERLKIGNRSAHYCPTCQPNADGSQRPR